MESKSYKELAQEVSIEVGKIPYRIYQRLLAGRGFAAYPKIQQLLNQEYYTKEEVDEKLKEKK